MLGDSWSLYLKQKAWDVQRKHVKQGSPLLSNINDKATIERLKHGQVGDGGDHPSKALSPSTSAAVSKERDPWRQRDRGEATFEHLEHDPVDDGGDHARGTPPPTSSITGSKQRDPRKQKDCDEVTLEHLENGKVDYGGDHPRGTPSPAPSTTERKERDPRKQRNRGEVTFEHIEHGPVDDSSDHSHGTPSPTSYATRQNERDPRKQKNRDGTTLEYLEHGQEDDGGDHPRGTPSPAPSTTERKERDPRKQRDRGEVTFEHIEHDSVYDGGDHSHGTPSPTSCASGPIERDPRKQKDRDETTLEYLEHGQEGDGGDYPRGTPSPAPSTTGQKERDPRKQRDQVDRQPEALLTTQHKPGSTLEGLSPSPTPLQSQDKTDRLHQEVEMSPATQHKRKSGPEQWERFAKGFQSSMEEDRPSVGSPCERERKNVESVKGDRSAEMEQLELAHTKEIEQFTIVLAEANHDRAQAHLELRKVRKSLDVCSLKQDESLREIDALRRELSSTKGSNRNLIAEIKRLKLAHSKEMDAAREEVKQEHTKIQYETEKLREELNTARDAHRREVEKLKMDSQEHIQRDRQSNKESHGAEIERLKLATSKETEQLKTALEEANRDRTQAISELQEVRKSLDAYTLKLDGSLGEIGALRRGLSNTKDSNRVAAELKHHLGIRSKELHDTQEELSALKREFNHLLTNLENRTSDPKSIQNFSKRTDTLYGTEVTSIIQRLNAEVLQSTAFMAESMVGLFFDKTTVQVAKSDERLAACKRASSGIGGIIVQFIGTKKHKDDPILIQIAFQACLTYHLHGIACTWIIDGDENQNRIIDAIYQSMHVKEAQIVAGRWRALTRAHIPSSPLDNSQTTLEIANRIISTLSDILLIARCNVPKSAIASALSSKFSEKLSFLVSLAMRANKIIIEDVTSSDFEVTVVQPATAFNATEMEDSYNSEGSEEMRGSSTSKVLCATELGLRKRTRVGMTSENQWETEVLLKPKVTLESVIDILDE